MVERKKSAAHKDFISQKLSLIKPLPILTPLGFGHNLPKNLFLIQPMMMKVVYALLPCLLGAVYFFGLRALGLCIFVLLLGIITEGFFTLRQGKPITSAVFVTSLIFTLSLPPTTPFWMAAVGIIFGVIFGKMVFGGFGHNIYNPAMAGRCFIYIAFPIALTNRWVEPFWGQTGGFSIWTPSVDAVTSATPLHLFTMGDNYSVVNLFFGNIAGSLGETSVPLILLGGIYIIATKSAPWRLALSCFLGGSLMASVLHFAGVPAVPNPVAYLMAGSFLFGTFFVVTEPVSGPKTKEAQWIYGLIIGALIIVLRKYSNFSEGVMFSVLFMNTFVPILDMAVRNLKQRKQTKSA